MERVLVLANRYPGGFRRGHPVDVGGFGFLPGIFTLLMVALVVLLIMNMRRPRGFLPLPAGPPTPRSGSDPLEAARMRYAKGEISRDEYVSLVGDFTESKEELGSSTLLRPHTVVSGLFFYLR